MSLDYTYQWLRDNVPINGATTPDYTIVDADSGHTLTFKVTASNNQGASIAISLPFPIPIAINAPVNTIAPSIDRAVIGSVSTLSQGTWTGSVPITYTYQWYVDAAPVSGATNQTYTPVSGDSGKSLYGIVTAHNSVGNASAQSNTFTVSGSASAPTNVVAPALSGATLGVQASTSNGTWNGTTPITYTYQWYINAAPISGQTSSVYTPVSGDVGKTLYCAVTAHNSVGNATTNSNSLTVADSSFIDIPTQTALYNMLAAGPIASGGKSYRLAAIDFGTLGLYNYDFSSNPILITGQTGTVVQWIEMAGVSGITWENFTVYGFNPSVNASMWIHSDNVFPCVLTFNNVISDSGTSEGSQSGNGWQLRNLQGSTIVINGQGVNTNPDIKGRGNALSVIDCFGSSTSIAINNITVTNNGVDGFIVSGSQNVTINANLFKNFYNGPGDHPDALQFFSSSGNPCTNITVTNNGIDGSNASSMQGIFMEGVVNTTIQNNWIFAPLFNNAISMSAGGPALIDNNFAQGINPPGGGGDIISRGGTTNNTVTNNTASALTNYAADGVNPGYIPAVLPGTNVIIPAAASATDYTYLDPWLTAHPTARRRV